MNGFLIRWAMAFVLLAATYNPTDWNYVSWTMVNFNRETAMTVLMPPLGRSG
jgi:hypothetical protein